MPDRLVVGISGASGAILGIRLLEVLAAHRAVETHLVISPAARHTIRLETDYTVAAVERLADVVYAPDDLGAAIASGSFATRGMVIIPCSIKTLSAVAHCYAADLIARAADVTLKERRPLVLVVRESPLHLGHLQLMVQATQLGATIYPPMPAFYARPRTLDELVDHLVGRILAYLGIANTLYPVWQGDAGAPRSEA
ncbi:MAG: 3-octaprenyl-4-hydroxybenzoate carboxy-lyase [Ardenticatenia bacterium]|nr:MAG: 3-octaprenyl-4-hydroxybenzoate carboxy-lyase [Ardenticatenia bacterium]